MPTGKYSDKKSLFHELLEKDGPISIHVRNLQVLATEMYKVINKVSTPNNKTYFP